MSESTEARPFPKGALLGAAALVGFALLATTVTRATGIGASHMPPAVAVDSRELRFDDRADGAVTGIDRSGQVVVVIEPGTNGFVRGVLRGLARERKRQEIGAQPPFVLTRWSDGRMTVSDPSTGRNVDLGAFGPSNWAAFAGMLQTEGPSS